MNDDDNDKGYDMFQRVHTLIIVMRYEVTSIDLMYSTVAVENNNEYLKFAIIVDVKCSHCIHTHTQRVTM